MVLLNNNAQFIILYYYILTYEMVGVEYFVSQVKKDLQQMS